MEPTHLSVRGAREHNLQAVDVDLPRGALVVITGVSGSGKSSLAFDTIHREGQRRFVESLSAYARQFLGQMERPKVDAVEGISPTLSIDQKTVNRNPRSTVGTVTEILDHLRLLFARLGEPRCPQCGTPIRALGVEQVVDHLLGVAAGEKAIVLAPVLRARKGEHRKELAQLQVDGWTRARVDGAWVSLDAPPELARYEIHTIEVVVDRCRIDAVDRSRLVEAAEVAVRLGAGALVVHLPDRGDGGTDLPFATSRACALHPDVAIPELEPRLFSFNAPQGACPTCDGLGALEGFDPERVLDGSAAGAACVRAFNDEGKIPFAWFDRADFDTVWRGLGAPAGPLSAWPADARDALLHGRPSLVWVQRAERQGRVEVRERPWKGLLPMLDEVWRWAPGFPSLERLRTRVVCPDCGGARLHAVARSVVFAGRRLPEVTALPVSEAAAWLETVALDGSHRQIGAQILEELRGRLTFLREVGLDYLTLDRSAATLSGGEAQRIRLAAQVGSALQGVTYVLDEPSIGLHPRDNQRLLGALLALRDRGNTVIVVEHDADTLQAADWVVDVGPDAGRHGGRVMASGPPAGVARDSRGPTGAWLRGELILSPPPTPRPPRGWLQVVGASANNLRGLDAALPLGVLCAVTGVSGSGKSTLIFDVLTEALAAHADGRPPARCAGLVGAEAIDAVVALDQAPIGRTPRSNPATYVGAFDAIRDLFAATPEARARGYKKGRFSFNVAGGRCAVCEGAGHQTIELQLLPSVDVPCDACGGRRFNAETLEIRWRGRSIAEVLDATVDEAVALFAAVPKVARILGALREVGLGYLTLGQPSTTLSGGEAQRVKIAAELARPARDKTLYILDEPTTGLHFADVVRLVDALQRLVDRGASVVVVEHHTDLVRCADWVVDLGPDGGARGGQLVAAGTPAQVAAADTPTGRVLAALLPPGAPVPLPAGAAAPARAAGDRALVVRGARAHNLQRVDVTIPHGQLTVITGPSGSGKTSLAFDTVFAEGQRQYVESLSTYARRFLGRMERAPVDRLEGLQPAIAIDQHRAGGNPRSTVATVTEIHDVLRVLWTRVGVPHCPVCGVATRAEGPSEAAARLRDAGTGAAWLVAPLAAAPDPAARRDALVAQGWSRLWTASGERPLDGPDAVAALAAGVGLVIDRVRPADAGLARLAEAFEIAYREGRGRAEVHPRGGGPPLRFTEAAVCADHGPVFREPLTPRHFSFNSHVGACPACDGLGVRRAVDPTRLFPRPDAGFWEAIDPRAAVALGRSQRTRALIGQVLAGGGADEATPASAWSPALRIALLEGLDDPVALSWSHRWGASHRQVDEARAWIGILALLEPAAERLDGLMQVGPCRMCGGARLRAEVRGVTVHDAPLHAFTARTIADAAAVCAQWHFTGSQARIAARPLSELTRRLRFLCDVGVGYLSLDRAADTLSGGEAQRIRLASQLGAGLTGTTYVLDEPTIGLHPRDTERLLQTLLGLRDLGNTVVVVEHDPDTIRAADWVVDLGPGAGRHGGQVVAVGTPEAIARDPASPTGPWLAGHRTLPARPTRPPPSAWFVVSEPTGNNLRGGTYRIPAGAWTTVTGVSGSGKSTLVLDTLAPALLARLGLAATPAPLGRLDAPPYDKVVVVDQAPIGRSPRSTPATFTGVFDALRKLFAETPAARQRGWDAGRFSYNTPGGRCEACEGRGATLVEMHFLPDVWVVCDACRGRRFGRETLEVRWRDRSIADVLALRADEALPLFSAVRAVRRPLQALVDVGLGYLQLGQPANTLSGGEAQRVKLAAELIARAGHAVYLLDEPTTGLHLSDVARLVSVLHQLVAAGHTVVTIEHHPGMMAASDWVIDLGPEGGHGGGLCMGEGTPEQVAARETPTGRAIRDTLHARGAR